MTCYLKVIIYFILFLKIIFKEQHPNYVSIFYFSKWVKKNTTSLLVELAYFKSCEVVQVE